MSKAVKYNGTPLAVYIDYRTGNYVIYDKKNKTYGAEYSSYDKALNHAKGWNKIWRAGASERARLGIK